jgi:hypothetical protein
MLKKRATWKYQDGSGTLKEASGIVMNPEAEDILNIQIWRDGAATNQVVNLPRRSVCLSDAVVAPALRDRFTMGTPSAAQMRVINQYLPSGIDPLVAEELVTVPFVAADNLVNRSMDRWDLKSLKTMSKLLPGLPALLDHDWEAEQEWGRIYNSAFIQADTAPDEALDRAGNGDSNRMIIAEEGFAQVVFEVFAPIDSPVVRALKRGHSGNISTGGFQFTDYHCPLCKCSFSDELCPHTIPDRWWSRASDAPFAIRVGMFDLGEASIVAIPNLPNAGII